jgi:hypothetical protein
LTTKSRQTAAPERRSPPIGGLLNTLKDRFIEHLAHVRTVQATLGVQNADSLPSSIQASSKQATIATAALGEPALAKAKIIRRGVETLRDHRRRDSRCLRFVWDHRHGILMKMTMGSPGGKISRACFQDKKIRQMPEKRGSRHKAPQYLIGVYLTKIAS